MNSWWAFAGDNAALPAWHCAIPDWAQSLGRDEMGLYQKGLHVKVCVTLHVPAFLFD
jgi:hypothetical protein